MKTLEQYFRENDALAIIDHSLRAEVDEHGTVRFYIHPANESGDTLNFAVVGNVLVPRVEIKLVTAEEFPVDDGTDYETIETRNDTPDYEAIH